MAGLGCTDLDRFSTGKGESYCGAITATEAFRAGFGPEVRMRLSLDAARLDGPGSPGKVSTFEPGDGTRPDLRLVDGADLRRIEAMENDVISRPDLGEGRLRTSLFAVTPADPAAEGVLAVVSLRSDETVEVRLLRPGVDPASAVPAPEGRRQLFGVFSLSRQAGTCGF